jgi:hypothetical protein
VNDGEAVAGRKKEREREGDVILGGPFVHSAAALGSWLWERVVLLSLGLAVSECVSE